jgi:hypothetical protein
MQPLIHQHGVVVLHAAIVTLESEQFLFNLRRPLHTFFMIVPAGAKDLLPLSEKIQFTFFLALLFLKIQEVGVAWSFVWLDRVGTIQFDQFFLDFRIASLLR